MKIDKWDFPDELLYDEHYQWIKSENKSVSFGLTAYGLEVTGDVLYLALPEKGTQVRRGEGCGSLEAGKWVGRVYAPVSGRVTDVNHNVVNRPGDISRDPYSHWLMKIELDDPAELLKLMKSGEVANWLAEELKKDA